MNNFSEFQNLHFERRLSAIPRKLIVVVLVSIGFSALWLLLPSGAMYWLLLIFIAILSWIASFGWQAALTVFIGFLQHQQRF